jgi:hypothetical protein
MASTLNFLEPIWAFDLLTNITSQNLPHLSAMVVYIKGVGYFRYAFFNSRMTQGKMYSTNLITLFSKLNGNMGLKNE